MAFLNLLRRLFFGFIWYLIIVNLMGFLLTLAIKTPLFLMGNEYSGQFALEGYSNNKWWMIIVAAGLSLYGTLKSVFPGTEVIWNKKFVLGKIQLRAVALGFLINFIVALALGFGIGIVMAAQRVLPSAATFDIPALLMTTLMVSGVAAVAGGYVAGRFAQESEVLHGSVVGVMGVMRAMIHYIPYPVWFNVIMFSAIILLSAFGGYLAKKKE